MKSNPLVSILITVYNREKYIAEAIESVLASSFENFEIIIVDDCSKDKSVEIAKRYEAKDNRIKVYVNENNLGDYPNRNKAAGYAKGKYLKYVDADDLIYPWGLELLVNMMEQFPEAGYGLCSLEQDMWKIFPFQISPKEAFYRHYFEVPLFHKASLSSIIKKSAFDFVEGYSGKQHVGDFEMWHKLSMHFSVVLMPHGIVWSREHEDQQMADNRSIPEVNYKYFLISEEFFTRSNPLDEKDRIKQLKNIKRKQVRYIIYILRKRGLNSAYQVYKYSNKSLINLLRHLF